MLVANLELKTTWQGELLFCVLASKLVKRMEKMCEYMGTKTLICKWMKKTGYIERKEINFPFFLSEDVGIMQKQ
jgi:hypothetical protein